MEESHFGWTRQPFHAGLDAGFYYPATTHEHALARLLQALGEGEGIVLLIGAPGTGKTLLCQCLLERLGDGAASAFLTHGHFPNRAGLLQAILFDLALPYEGKGEQELRLALTDHLLKNYAAGRPTVLVVDEAHHLTPDLLEELRLLANLEGRGGRAVQVVLVGQPGILDALGRPELGALAQRLAVRVALETLGAYEAADYLLHHLRLAGGRPETLISDEALDVLARGTAGNPRRLNQAARQAFRLARANNAPAVDAEAAVEALASLGLDADLGAAGEDGFPSREAAPPAPEKAVKSGQPRVTLSVDDFPHFPAARRPA